MTKINEEEIWKSTLEGWYLISNHGRLKGNGKRKTVIKLFISKRGYYRYHAKRFRKNFGIHRLVAEAFIENSENKPEVNHIDGNKLNNAASNLEWVTASENHKHAFRAGLQYNSVKQRAKASVLGKSKAKLVIQSDKTGKIIKLHKSVTEAARCLSMNERNVGRYCRGERTHSTFNFEYEKQN